MVSTTSATGSKTCSQLSTTNSNCLVCQELDQRVRRALSRPGGHPEQGGKAVRHRIGVAHRCEFYEPRTLPKPWQHLGRDLERQPRLADPSHSSQRDDRRVAQRRRSSDRSRVRAR